MSQVLQVPQLSNFVGTEDMTQKLEDDVIMTHVACDQTQNENLIRYL